MKQSHTRYFLYGTVFITGAAVLVIEVAAVRMLSPFFGSSLFVFSSVLTVILGALSVGYYIGGVTSDRYPTYTPLYCIILLGGFAVLFLQWLSLFVLPKAGVTLSLITGPLLLSLLFFFIPSFLLGMVSPYVIKLQSLMTEKERVGAVVGATFFWGTIGSIIGSLGSGFLFIPLFGITDSMSGTGGALVLLGALGAFLLGTANTPAPPPQGAYVRIFVFVIVIVSLTLVGRIERGGPSDGKAVLFEGDGLYSHIRVYEADHLGEKVRILERDTNTSSGVFLNSYDLPFGYAKFAEFYALLNTDAEHFLLLGGGAFSIPRTLEHKDSYITVDVVEIEPSLHELGKQYFDVPETERIRGHVGDARVFLTKSDETYDVIFEDTFGTDRTIPVHLATKEFFEEVKRHLNDDGLFFLNYIGTLEDDGTTLTSSLTKTLREVFPNVNMYALRRGRPWKNQNIMFIARKNDEPIRLPNIIFTSTEGDDLHLHDLMVNLDKTFDFNDDIVFTDDRAPVEYLMAKQL